MPTYTTHFNLEKPSISDSASPVPFSNDLDIIDTKLYQLEQAIAAKQDQITIDNAISPTSENPVQNKVIKKALDWLQPFYAHKITVPQDRYVELLLGVTHQIHRNSQLSWGVSPYIVFTHTDSVKSYVYAPMLVSDFPAVVSTATYFSFKLLSFTVSATTPDIISDVNGERVESTCTYSMAYEVDGVYKTVSGSKLFTPTESNTNAFESGGSLCLYVDDTPTATDIYKTDATAIIMEPSVQTEEITVHTTDWVATSGISPFTVSATKTLATVITGDIILSLGVDALVQAASGIVIGSTSGQDITLYAVTAPVAHQTIDVIIDKP